MGTLLSCTYQRRKQGGMGVPHTADAVCSSAIQESTDPVVQEQMQEEQLSHKSTVRCGQADGFAPAIG
jgi:hypothetical protein